jgi:hypothetical protein
VSRVRPAALPVILCAVAALAGYLMAGCSSGAGGAPRTGVPSLRGVSEPPGAPAIPPRGAYFGAWVRQGAYTQPNQIVALQGLQAAVGRRLDIVHTYLTWQGPFPTLSDEMAVRQGSMLLISWTGTSSAAVVSGRYDGVIRQRALQIKAIGKPVFLEWRWEMDRPNLAGQVGNPAEYIAAWKHVRDIFAKEHVNNVAWVWCPTAKGFAQGGNAPAYYPGNSQVDWICADVYPGAGPYRSFAEAAGSFLTWASHHRKPVMIGEFGVPQRYGPALRAQWLRAAAATVQADPQIKALVYFDADPAGAGLGNSTALDYGTPPMQAFRKIADSPYFNPAELRSPG